jgi:hypothetical protein
VLFTTRNWRSVTFIACPSIYFCLENAISIILGTRMLSRDKSGATQPQAPTFPIPHTAVHLHFAVAQLNPAATLLFAAPKISRHRFRSEEDELLRSLVDRFGTECWYEISRHLEGRSPRQCRERWFHYLSPKIVHGNWSSADDRLLISQVELIGQKWAEIARIFPGRTAVALKNRYVAIGARQGQIAVQTDEIDGDLH